MIEQNHPYQIGIQSAIPPNVLFWQFELQSTRFPHDLNDIPEIPTIEDEIEEKELESPSSSFPIQSSLQDENNMNFLFDFTNLELDTSFPDLVSGPTSFILQLIFLFMYYFLFKNLFVSKIVPKYGNRVFFIFFSVLQQIQVIMNVILPLTYLLLL